MLFKRKSLFTGKWTLAELPLTDKDNEALLDYLAGMKSIREALPQLTPGQTLWLQTGVTPDEWAMMQIPGEEKPVVHDGTKYEETSAPMLHKITIHK